MARNRDHDLYDRTRISYPHTYLVRMVIFLGAVAAVVAVLAPALAEAFVANLAINGVIAGVLLIGVAYILLRVTRLNPEVRWINAFRKRGEAPPTPKRSYLVPLAQMFRERNGPVSLSTVATRSMLDSIASRLDESRDISRYMIGLLVFLGLLGTFWGLLQTVSAVGDVINSMSVSGGRTEEVFSQLQEGLQGPLTGMGTAFSSSLFGLGGSLVLGFLDLQAAQAQNRFYNELEEWLSSMTRMTSAGGVETEGAAPQSVPAYMTALLEQTADNLQSLEETMARAARDRAEADEKLSELADHMATFTELMRAEQRVLMKLAEGQTDLKPTLEKLTGHLEGLGSSPSSGSATEQHLKTIERTLRQILDETRDGRQDLTQGMRQEIKLLARTISASLAETGDAAGGGAAGGHTGVGTVARPGKPDDLVRPGHERGGRED